MGRRVGRRAGLRVGRWVGRRRKLGLRLSARLRLRLNEVKAAGVPLRRVREKALAPVGRVRAVVVDAALAIDFLVSSTEAAQHVAAAKHRLLANRPPTTSFFCSAEFCALIGDSFSCAAFPKASRKKVGQRASQGDAGAEGDGSLHQLRSIPNFCAINGRCAGRVHAGQ